MSWTLVLTRPFEKGYKNKTLKLRATVDDSIKLLVESDDPRTLGRLKYGSLQNCYGHDIDFTHRLLYHIDMVKKNIYFLNVCTHKRVYGR